MESPVKVAPTTHREKCEFWARIFAMPHAEFRHVGGKIVRFDNPAGEASLFAAEALRAYAGVDELRRALRQVLQLAGECSEPQGWLAHNVKSIAAVALRASGE